MNKLFLLVLAVIMTACTAAQAPAPLLPEASPTPVVVVQTVVVEATPAPTDVPPPTALPPVVVTVLVQPTQASAPQPPAAASPDSSAGPIKIDDILGKGVFINMTMSNNDFSLRCLPREITFNITTNLPDIVEAELFYRTVDQPKALYYKEWRSAGKMESDKSGNFSIVFKGEAVHPDYRLDLAWFEFQFVGLNKGGGVVDRTQKIEKLVTYRVNCP